MTILKRFHFSHIGTIVIFHTFGKKWVKILNLHSVTPKGISLCKTASYEPSCVKISSVFFL